MKKFFCWVCALILILSCGCKTVTSQNNSSYNETSSNIEIEYVVEDIEEPVEDKNNSDNKGKGVSTNVSTDKEPSSDTSVVINETVTAPPQQTNAEQTVIIKPIIDDSMNADNAIEIEEADINTVGSKPLYYSTLTSEQQRIYRLIVSAVENMSTDNIRLDASSDSASRHADIVISFRAVSFDNPKMFWMPNSYITSPDGSVFSLKDCYTITSQEKEKMQQKLTAVVEDLTIRSSNLKSRYEKELFIHDWLCENVVYGFNDNTVFTAYGALVNGVAVCEGYSRAMQLLCDSLGIPCVLVCGTSNSQDHMWNVIDPGDGWYHLDVTWDDDDTNGYIRHSYVNLSDSQIVIDHTLSSQISQSLNYSSTDNFNFKTFECNQTAYNYFVKSHLTLQDGYDKLAAAVKKNNVNGIKHIEIFTGTNNNYSDIISNISKELRKDGSSISFRASSISGNSLLLIW